MSQVWVLQKEQGEWVTPIGVYENFDDLLARLGRIEKANPYNLKQLSKYVWEIGPEEDQGFFGHKPVTLMAILAPYQEAK